MNYMELIEADLAEILTMLGMTEIAMLLFHRGWVTLDKLAEVGHQNSQLHDFNRAIRMQYMILLKPLDTLEILINEFWIVVCTKCNEKRGLLK